MLGYVLSYKPEMKVKDAELYNGYYCGVCKSIGNRYSQLPRMVLSYDAAFLALLLDCVCDEKENTNFEHCIAHHIKKVVVVRNDSIDFAADVMLALAWYKLIDDANDEGKISAKVLQFVEKGNCKKVKGNIGELFNSIGEELESLSVIEKNECPSIDEAAETFSKVMEMIFEKGLKRIGNNDKNTKILFKRLGYHLGKWIYLIDAFDDIEDNIKSGAYNPLIYRFNYLSGEDISKFKDRIKKQVEFNLLMYLSEMGKTFDLIEVKKNKDIVENIIYIGLLNKTEEVLKTVKKEESDESV